MDIEEIRKNAPNGATHYSKMFRTVYYMKVIDHYLYWWRMDGDFEHEWIIVGCRSILKGYITTKLIPLY